MKMDGLKNALNQAELPSKNTPLHFATYHRGNALVKILLENGADESLFKMNADNEVPINLIQTQVIRDHLDSKVFISEGKYFKAHLMFI